MKKLLAIGVIVLFLGLACAPSINANETETTEVFDRALITALLLFPERSDEYIEAFVPRMKIYYSSPPLIPPIIPPPWWTYKIRFKEAIGSFYRVYIGIFNIIGYMVGFVKDYEIIPL